jgi:NADPH:quinone reductase-like Zn-dependent oxidoreductase
MSGNKSIVVTSTGAKFTWSVEDRPIPEAVSGSVVIQVLHAPTIQYSKGQFDEHAWYPVPLPFGPGANGVGRVHALGSDATSLKVGDLVLVNSVIAPRDSMSDRLLFAFATDGSPAAQSLMKNDWRNGTYAQYVRIPLENAFQLDEKRLCGDLGYKIGDLSMIQTCAVGYGGLADGDVKAGDTVIVAPATGRFSGATVLTALAMGANVIAAGRRQEPLNELVKAMGKSATLKTVLLTGDVEKDTESFKGAVGPKGADFYVDWSPPAISGTTPAYLTAALNVMKRKGTFCLMGGVGAGINIPYNLVMLKCLTIRGRFMYEPEQLERCVKLAESGRLPLGKNCGMGIIASYGLDKFEEALDEATKYPGWGNVVEIVPSQ